MDELNRLDEFVALSSALTGVTTEQLKPTIDPIGIAAQYLTAVQKKHAAELGDAITAFQQQLTMGKTPEGAAEAVLAMPRLGSLCRSIIAMWLLGTLYDPAKAETGQIDAAVEVVSSQTYKESLVWKVMQSHPMGYSMFSFGYWSEPPPPLGEFIFPPAPETPSNG